MKKWLILAFILISASAYLTSSVLNSVNDPVFCAGCHETEYRNYKTPFIYSDMPAHKEKKITCFECHTPPTDFQSDLAARKLLLKAKIINSSLPAINELFKSNFTFNETFNISEFPVLKPDCIKCHNTTQIKTQLFNHSNATTCQTCHLLHKEPEKSDQPENPFWKRMGEGGHKNSTCGDCHGTEPTQLGDLPQCTKCHIPHLKGAQWDRSTCLGCHDNPHIPLKNAVFKGTITKEMCSACHNDIYKILTIYDSKHNSKVPACINCHPVHRTTQKCWDCHDSHQEGAYHPDSKCNTCHAYVNTCTDCHTNPHAPLSGLPMATGEALKDLAKQRGGKIK